MSANITLWGQVDENGRLVLAPEVVAQFGLTPGAQVGFEADERGFRLRRPVSHQYIVGNITTQSL